MRKVRKNGHVKPRKSRKRRAGPLFNARLRKLAPGVTVGQVARATGVSSSAVSLYFSQKRRPRLRVAQAMAEYLGLSLSELVESLDCPLSAVSPLVRPETGGPIPTGTN